MLIRYIAKYRHILTAIVAILFLGGMVYFGVKTSRMKNISINADVYSGNALGTAVKKTLYAETTAQSEEVNSIINDCLKEFEQQMSVRIADSEVAKCNRGYATGGVYPLSSNILDYLEQEMQICEETNGALSPCIRPISNLWGIEDGETEIPDDQSIQDALQNTNVDDLELVDSGIIFHKAGMAIDFGAVGKGAACDEVRKLLAETQIKGAVISIGGSVLIYGDKGDGKEWHIGIQDPRAEEGEVLGVVDLVGNQIVSTSGDYEKYFESDGKRYHHIFDPATGYPADSGLISVTIISDNGFLSDALSTACFVMGLENGMTYAEEKGVEAVFVTSDKKVYITQGIKKKFRLMTEEYGLEK